MPFWLMSLLNSAIQINPKTKNKRWPFPTLHVFEGIQEYSHCGRIAREDERLTISSEPPAGVMWTVCEKCVYGRPTLRDEIYTSKRRKK